MKISYAFLCALLMLTINSCDKDCSFIEEEVNGAGSMIINGEQKDITAFINRINDNEANITIRTESEEMEFFRFFFTRINIADTLQMLIASENISSIDRSTVSGNIINPCGASPRYDLNDEINSEDFFIFTKIDSLNNELTGEFQMSVTPNPVANDVPQLLEIIEGRITVPFN